MIMHKLHGTYIIVHVLHVPVHMLLEDYPGVSLLAASAPNALAPTRIATQVRSFSKSKAPRCAIQALTVPFRPLKKRSRHTERTVQTRDPMKRPCARALALLLLLALAVGTGHAVCWPARGTLLANGYAACTTVVAAPHGGESWFSAGPSGNDVLSGVITIPGFFLFGDRYVSNLVISSNGVIFFRDPYGSSDVPATTQPSPTGPLPSALQGYIALGSLLLLLLLLLLFALQAGARTVFFFSFLSTS
jgi:hypothetical protein